MKVLIISGSLHPASRSRLLARHLTEVFDSMQVEAQMIDLRDIDMPLCDGTGEGKTLDVTRLAAEITNAAFEPASMMAKCDPRHGNRVRNFLYSRTFPRKVWAFRKC